MPISEELIKAACQNNITYTRGRQYFRSGRVSPIHIVRRTLDGNAYTLLSAKVEGSDYAPYKAEIALLDEPPRIVSGECTCPAYAKGDGLCKHLAAMLLQYLDGLKKEEPTLRTSAAIYSMIGGYQTQTLSETLPSEAGVVCVEPMLHLYCGMPKVEFKIGVQRKYVLYDIFAFAEAMEQGLTVSYGKQLTFLHSMSAFTPASIGLVRFILDKVAEDRILSQVYNPMSFFHRGNTRQLILTPGDLDTLFDLLYGQAVEAQLSVSQNNVRLTLLKENPVLSLKLIAKGGGAQLLLDPLQFFQGNRHCYVCLPEKNTLYQCDEAYSREMRYFLQPFGRSKPDLSISRKDFPAFCSSVLPTLKKHVQLEESDFNLEKLLPPPAKFSVYLDSPHWGCATCTPQITYAGQTFNPLVEGVRAGSRDPYAEQRLLTLVRTYFPSCNQKEQCAELSNDVEALYRLLSEGVPALREAGEVYVSDSFKRLKLEPAPRVQVGISLKSDLLSLKLECGGLSFDELYELLDSYRQKKRYHLLRNGTVFRLEKNDALNGLSQLAAEHAPTQEEKRASTLMLPAHRALVVDSLVQKQQVRSVAFQRLVSKLKNLETDQSPQPDGLRTQLRPYQLTGFRWLRTLDSLGFGGILADDMGLGKTVQVIALLLSCQKQEKLPTLVVCPASLVYNWEQELTRFAPGLSTMVIAGSSARRRELLSHAGEYEVLITSYDLLRRDLECYQPLRFRFHILDEAQFIKNHTTQAAKAVKRIASHTRFALTGTPIENRLSELWSILDFLMPGFLYSYARFKRELELPIVQQEDEEAAKRLHQMIAPFLLRRLKQDVLTELPEKQEEVVYCRMEAEQQRLYSAHVQLMRESLLKQTGEEYEHTKLQLLSQLTRLRQLCCHPALCYENYHGASAKLETCLELLRNAVDSGHSVLLFSQFTSMLDLLRQKLETAGLPYFLLTGETDKRERLRLVERFNQKEAPIFLISLKAGGTGLNLTAADIVIHYDPWWNQAVQNQATDRAHRIGQQNIVTVYKLLVQDSIEEKISQLQSDKQELAESVLAGNNVSIASLSKEELLQLLR